MRGTLRGATPRPSARTSSSRRSAKPSRPSERQKRTTVGSDTPAALASEATVAETVPAGSAATSSATFRSAGLSRSITWAMRSARLLLSRGEAAPGVDGVQAAGPAMPGAGGRRRG
jgi:hypothetical protein